MTFVSSGIWIFFIDGVPSNDNVGTVLAKPKSQSLTWQLQSIRMLDGLKSLCITLAVCKKLVQVRMLYRRTLTCPSSKSILCDLLRTLLRSEQTYSMTMKIWSCSPSFTWIRSSSLGVKMLFFINDSLFMIYTSPTTARAMPLPSNMFYISLIATCCFECLSLAKTTSPWAPIPTYLSRVYF